MIQIIDLPAIALASAIGQGEVSPLEAVNAHLERIEQMRALNAVVTVRGEQARDEARRAEMCLRAGAPHGPLLGVPFTAKDVIATARDRTTCGSKLFADHVARRDATAVARLRAAGGILLGKTNTSEFALDPHTDNLVFGATCNPWDVSLTPGGSSGGESAAVAAGCSALGVGSDFGGSLRWPAHCTGLIAIRPTFGLVPSTGLLPNTSPFDPAPLNSLSFKGRTNVLGPIARSVDDVALALRLMAGPDGLDPAVTAAASLDSQEVDLAALRCAWCPGEGTFAVRDDIVRTVETAAGQLAALGLSVAACRPRALDGADALYGRLRDMEGLQDIRATVGDRTAALGARMRAALDEATTGRIEDLLAAGVVWDAARAAMREFLLEFDILLLPVASVPAFTAGDARVPVDGDTLSPWQVLSCCRAISLFGLPAAVVPCGLSREGLPVGVQVVGAPFRDGMVLAVARLLEQVCGGVRPPTSFPVPAKRGEPAVATANQREGGES